MRFDKHILSVILLVAALLYTLSFVFAGFGNHQDPLYWLYKYEHLEGGWMAVGTLLTGGGIVRLFGAQLLPLRLAGWACVVVAIAMPYCCLLTKEQRRENLHWLALTYLLMGYGAFQEFSPGTLSVLLLSTLWVTQSPVVLGLAVAARFPNILALLLLIPLWKKQSLWKIPVAALSAGVIYLLGYWFVTPSPMDAAMTSHDLLAMLTKLWEKAGLLIAYGLMAVGVLTFKDKKYAAYIVGVLVALVAFYTTKPLQWYNTDLTYMLSAFVLVIAFSQLSTLHTFRSCPWAKNSQLFIPLIATLGTDTAWLKLFPAVLCLLSVAAAGYQAPVRRYLFTVMAIFSVVVVMRMTTNSVGQTNLTSVQTISSVSPYKGIVIRDAEQDRLNQYIADYNYQLSNVLSVGQECHLIRAVTGCQAARFNEFWSNIFDSVYTAKYREIIRAEHPVVFCSFSPQFKTKPLYKDKESAFERMLLEEGYQPLDRSNYKYMLYLPGIDK